MSKSFAATPILRVNLRVCGHDFPALLKMEWVSATGSVKDRTARGLVTDLAAREILRPESVLIESTSGNLGVALAREARKLGLKFVAVVDPKISPRHEARIHEYGGQTVLVTERDHTGGFLLSRLERIQQMLADDKRQTLVWTNQYENPANPKVHFESTGPELAEQFAHVDVLFVAVSTGGTLAGISRYLRKHKPQMWIVAVDAVGSSAINEATFGFRRLTGIGASRKSSFLTNNDYDESIIISDVEAFTACWAIAQSIGLRLGGSSGAVVAAASKYLAENPETRAIGLLVADSGNAYAETIYSNSWLEREDCVLDRSMLPLEGIQ